MALKNALTLAVSAFCLISLPHPAGRPGCELSRFCYTPRQIAGLVTTATTPEDGIAR